MPLNSSNEDSIFGDYVASNMWQAYRRQARRQPRVARRAHLHAGAYTRPQLSST